MKTSVTRIILVVILVAAIVVVWRTRRPPPAPSVAYVSDRVAALWNTTAQVRQQVAELGYGEKVSVLRQSGDQSQIKTADGAQGWIDSHSLMDPALWQKAADLLARSRTLPVQAVGHTRTVSNVHLEPGRDTARIFQFGRNVPVTVLERKVMAAPAAPTPEGPPPSEEPAPATDDSNASDAAKPDESKPKNEDWLLVARAERQSATSGASTSSGPAASAPAPAPAAGAGQDIPVAGWVLARFVDLDAPAPIPDYSNAAGTRVVAWFALNTVPDDDNGAKPQYLVAGTKGGEGQPCDFTTLRVYTWDAPRQRYETAYVESDFCGMLPIQVTPDSGAPEFRFTEGGPDGQQRLYRMKETIVRRVNTSATPGKRRRSAQ